MGNGYKPHEWGEVKYRFNRLMPGIPVSEIHDGWYTELTGRLSIDPVKLDDILAKMYPDEAGTLSTKEIIGKHYGAKAVRLMEELL